MVKLLPIVQLSAGTFLFVFGDNVLPLFASIDVCCVPFVDFQWKEVGSYLRCWRKIFIVSFYLSRIFWIFVCLSVMAYFVVQLTTSIIKYYQYGTTTDVQVIYSDSVPFPAVTLCNQNTFSVKNRSFTGGKFS